MPKIARVHGAQCMVHACCTLRLKIGFSRMNTSALGLALVVSTTYVVEIQGKPSACSYNANIRLTLKL